MAGGATLYDNIIDDLVTVVDDLRGELHAMAGVRQWRVYTFRRAWTGDYVGCGRPVDSTPAEITPSPKVELDDSHTLTPGGTQESGTATLTGVSLTYTQDELLGQPLGSNEEFFYLLADGLGQGIETRWYIPQDHPVTERSKLGWQVVLRRVDGPPNVVGTFVWPASNMVGTFAWP